MIIDENIKTSNDSNDGSMVGNENLINNALENDLRDAINCEIEDKSINETCGNDNIEEDEEEDEEEDNAENDEKLGIELNKQVVEALLFANGEELSLEKLEEALQVPKDQILFWIDELCKKFCYSKTAAASSQTKIVMEKITQKLDNPVEFPSIFGPRILPSICCSMIMNITK